MAISAETSTARLGGGFSFGRSMTVPTTSQAASRLSPRSGSKAAGYARVDGRAEIKNGLRQKLLLVAAAGIGFVSIAQMLGMDEGFAQILLLLIVAWLVMYVVKWKLSGKAPQRFPWEDPEKNRNVYQEMEDVDRGHCSTIDSTLPEELKRAKTNSFEIPTEFDQENFLHAASAYFTLLQKAWDTADMASLGNYCTDQMFIELTHQRRAIRGFNETKVVSLKTSLAGFETTVKEYVASVLFQGDLVENGIPTKIKEIWNLTKPKEGTRGWLLAGIQQA